MNDATWKNPKQAIAVGAVGTGLNFTVLDCKELAQRLVDYCGFEVKLGISHEWNTKLLAGEIAAAVSAAELFLFFFSGHGRVMNRHLQLQLSSGEWLPLDDLLGMVSHKSPDNPRSRVLLVLDTCRQEVPSEVLDDLRNFWERARGAVQDAVTVRKDPTIEVLFACKHGLNTNEYPEKGGIMTQALCAALDRSSTENLNAIQWHDEASEIARKREGLTERQMDYFRRGGGGDAFPLLDWKATAFRLKRRVGALENGLRAQATRHQLVLKTLRTDLARALERKSFVMAELDQLDRDILNRITEFESTFAQVSSPMDPLVSVPMLVTPRGNKLTTREATLRFNLPFWSGSNRILVIEERLGKQVFEEFREWSKTAADNEKKLKSIWTTAGLNWLRSNPQSADANPCWWEAMAICNWLSTEVLKSRSVCYQDNGADRIPGGMTARLPTFWEMETLRGLHPKLPLFQRRSTYYTTCYASPKVLPEQLATRDDPLGFGRGTENRRLYVNMHEGGGNSRGSVLEADQFGAAPRDEYAVCVVIDA